MSCLARDDRAQATMLAAWILELRLDGLNRLLLQVGRRPHTVLSAKVGIRASAIMLRYGGGRCVAQVGAVLHGAVQCDAALFESVRHFCYDILCIRSEQHTCASAAQPHKHRNCSLLLVVRCTLVSVLDLVRQESSGGVHE
jgi:hypothetical protein